MGVLGGLILKPTAVAPIPRNGLVAEYLANNNFLDTSGNGYNGVNNNVTFGPDRNTNPNSAFVLNGTNAFINIDAALSGLSATTKGTWALWTKPTTALRQQEIIFFADTNANQYIRMLHNTDGSLHVTATEGGVVKWNIRTTSSVFSDATWAFVALGFDGLGGVLHVDNIIPSQVYSTEVDKTVWFNDIPGIDNGRIGDRNFLNLGEQLFYLGSIDDVRFYNRDLSQEEVTALFNE